MLAYRLVIAGQIQWRHGLLRRDPRHQMAECADGIHLVNPVGVGRRPFRGHLSAQRLVQKTGAGAAVYPAEPHHAGRPGALQGELLAGQQALTGKA